MTKSQFYIQLVWNREFHWVYFGEPKNSKDEAIRYAKSLLDMGDGARVKKIRVVDDEENVVWH